jgi:hypothetical protein
VRILVSAMVTASVLATALASVRLHHEVIRQRYRLGELERQRERVDRDLRLAVAELEAAKAPRRLMEHALAREGTDGLAAAARAPVAPRGGGR